LSAYPSSALIRERGAQLLRVLIAEDELMIADLIEETLITNGYEVCGIATTVEGAVALGERHRPDLAVLDVRLAKGGHGPDIARRLNSKGNIGILYETGDDARNSDLTQADGEASLAKPYGIEDLVRALAIVREIAAGGSATPPFPRGFRLLPKSAVRIPQAASA
jgi:DNA-binding response OmpR family regulator